MLITASTATGRRGKFTDAKVGITSGTITIAVSLPNVSAIGNCGSALHTMKGHGAKGVADMHRVAVDPPRTKKRFLKVGLWCH